MIKFVLLLTVIFAVTNAFVCPKDYCNKVNCEDLTECREENGLRVKEKAGFCQCCDICVKILGEGEKCDPLVILGVIKKEECDTDLYCDPVTRKCLGFEV